MTVKTVHRPQLTIFEPDLMRVDKRGREIKQEGIKHRPPKPTKPERQKFKDGLKAERTRLTDARSNATRQEVKKELNLQLSIINNLQSRLF